MQQKKKWSCTEKSDDFVHTGRMLQKYCTGKLGGGIAYAFCAVGSGYQPDAQAQHQRKRDHPAHEPGRLVLMVRSFHAADLRSF